MKEKPNIQAEQDVNRAVCALRETPIPAGPSPETLQAVLAAGQVEGYFVSGLRSQFEDSTTIDRHGDGGLAIDHGMLATENQFSWSHCLHKCIIPLG